MFIYTYLYKFSTGTCGAVRGQANILKWGASTQRGDWCSAPGIFSNSHASTHVHTHTYFTHSRRSPTAKSACRSCTQALQLLPLHRHINAHTHAHVKAPFHHHVYIHTHTHIYRQPNWQILHSCATATTHPPSHIHTNTQPPFHCHVHTHTNTYTHTYSHTNTFCI